MAQRQPLDHAQASSGTTNSHNKGAPVAASAHAIQAENSNLVTPS
jgi:hypothetical protein